MDRLAGVLFTGFVVLLAVTAVGAAFGRFGLVADLTIALVGLGFLAGGVLSLAEAGQRVHQLVRLALADVHGGHDVASLSPGTHWLRVEADVTATDGTVRGILDDGPAVAVTVEGDVRERFAGLPWPSKSVGSSFERTDAVPAALDGAASGVTFAADPGAGDDVRVVGGERRRLTAGEITDRVERALADHDVDVAADVFRGQVFEHYVRLTEATVPDGGTVRLFGPVRVESGSGETTLSSAGRFASRPLLTTAGWGAIRRRMLRRLGTLALVGPVVGGGGLVLLSLAVPSLFGW